MEKKEYKMPQSVVVEVKVQQPLAESQFNAPVHDPSDEVDAGYALSRKNKFSWDEDEE